MTKLTCTNCGEKHDKMYMSIECSDCYFNGINKELKKATITERKKVLGLIKKYRKQTVYNSVPNKILIKIEKEIEAW